MNIRKEKLTQAVVDKIVVLAGTQYDAKRKLSDRNIATIKRNLNKGKTIKEMAKRYKVVPQTIKYNIDEEYRRNTINSRSGVHYGTPDWNYVFNRSLRKLDLLNSRAYMKKYGSIVRSRYAGVVC